MAVCLTNSRSSFLPVSSTPGPGSYDPPSKICEGPFYTLKGRIIQKPRLGYKQPGPGAYDLPVTRVPSYVMGISKRESLPPDNVKCALPGPGTYSIPHEYLGCQWSFKPPRNKSKRPASAQPPSSYNLKSTLSNISFSLGSKRPLTGPKPNNGPGPGAYNPELLKSKSSTFLSMSNRFGKESNSIPGPGAYSIKSRPGTSCSFGSGDRTKFIRKIECHESYDLPTTIGSGPKISLHPKLEGKLSNPGPGPGTYYPEEPKHVPTFLFGSADVKEKKIKSLSPGPIYKVEASLVAPCIKFVPERKKLKKARSEMPGPGSYEAKSTLSQPRITFKKRHVDMNGKYLKIVPGPGAYDPVVKSDFEPGWTLSKADRGLGYPESQKKSLKATSNPNLKPGASKILLNSNH